MIGFSASKHSWWFLVFPLGCLIDALAAIRGVNITIFGVDLVYLHGFLPALSLAGWWLVFCLWLIAVIDLALRVTAAGRGRTFVELPGNISFPPQTLPWLVIVGMFFGLLVGHFFW